VRDGERLSFAGFSVAQRGYDYIILFCGAYVIYRYSAAAYEGVFNIVIHL
jgi:hypothetical protein